MSTLLLLLLLLSLLLTLTTLLYLRLHHLRFQQYAHIPQPPTSLIWGHMSLLHRFMSHGGGPSDRHIDLALTEIWHSLSNPPLFLMDLRPVGPCLCIIASHHLAEQISSRSSSSSSSSSSTQNFPYSVPKSYTVGEELKLLVGHDSIIIKEGHEWKELRRRFNPGFAPGHLMGLLPCVAEKGWMFLRLLERVAEEGKTVKLDKLTQGLTVDVIGEVVMEVDVGAQEELLRKKNLGEEDGDEEDRHDEQEEGLTEMEEKEEEEEEEKGQQMSNFTKTYYRLITSYAADGKPPMEWLQLLTSPFSRQRRQYLSQKVDTFLREFVQRKHLSEFQNAHTSQQQQQQQQPQSHPTTTTTTTTFTQHGSKKTAAPPKSRRSILSLSLSDQTNTPVLPEKILSTTTDALKTFLFAGHDTTAILIGWVLYYLSICPRAHARICSELDSIFGRPAASASPSEIRAQLSGPEGPDKLNQMVYTHAVIKEALRLHPPAGTARRAEVGSGFVVVSEPCQEKGGGKGGGEWNLDGMVLYNCATIIHRDASVYGETKDEFWPERWLSESENKEEIPAGAWRPFERGPRDCIGRDLAIIEAKVVVALVHRRYEFVKVGLGEMLLDGTEGKPVVDRTGCCMVKERLYTRRQVTARAADGMRMKVRLAKGMVGILEG